MEDSYCNTVSDSLNQLYQPQKVKYMKFVTETYYHKHNYFHREDTYFTNNNNKFMVGKNFLIFDKMV